MYGLVPSQITMVALSVFTQTRFVGENTELLKSRTLQEKKKKYMIFAAATGGKGGEGGGGGVLVLCMVVVVCMSIDHRIPRIVGRSTSSFHRPCRHRVHRARTAAVRCLASRERYPAKTYL